MDKERLDDDVTAHVGQHGVETFPLSPAQLGIWYAQHLDPSVPITIAQYVDIEGDLDLRVLRRASTMGAREIESGFVRIVEVGADPMQVVDHSMSDPLYVIDLRESPDPEAAAADWMLHEYSKALDLFEDRLIYAAVLHIGERRYYWYTRVHHLILDGFGAMTFMNRVAAIYTAWMQGTEPGPAKASGLRKLYDAEVSYRDSTRFVNDREYWAGRVAGLETETSLTGRSAAPAARNRLDSAALDARTSELLDAATVTPDVTPAMLLIAAFAAFLAQSTDSEDVVLSLPVTARTTAMMRRSGGMVSNIVPLRLRIGGTTTIGEILDEVRLAVSGALRHQRYRHEDIRRDNAAAGTSIDRDLFGPIVNIMLFGREIVLDDATGALNILTTGVVEDLAVNLYDSVGESRLHVDFEANPNLYTADVATANHARFLAFFTRFLEADSDTRGWDVPLLDSDERKQVLTGWNSTQHRVDSDATLVSMFERTATALADAPAITFEDEDLSYAEFAAEVNRLARWLIERGVGPDALVGIAMRRSIEMMVAIYAVVSAGGAYVPLDPDQPADRIGHILQTASPVCVLTRTSDGFAVVDDVAIVAVDELDLSDRSPSRIADHERVAALRPAHLAYVIFTSGSTGQPKGVAVSHASVVNRLVWMQAEYPLRTTDVVLQKTPVTFDVSVWELFWPLQIGARLVVAAPDGHRDPGYLVRTIASERVTTIHFVPSMLSVFVAAAESGELTSLRLVFASGEALPAQTAATARERLPHVHLHNLYGPTEAAVDVTYHEVTAADKMSVPIGAPVFNTQVYILDSRLRPVPVGAPGELYLAGVQLARGYVARADLTADRFVASPFGAPGARMYRTGDLAFWRPNGELDYVGRTDFQVKLRGFRIELGEIEAIMLAQDSVAQAVVVLRSDAIGDRLVGYVVPAPGKLVDVDALRAALVRTLPEYMVPDSVQVLSELPLNPSGKLDRKALPAPVVEAQAYRAPTTPAEEIAAGIFAEVLGAERVGLDDNFFAMGGNSLIAMRLVARLGEVFGVTIGVRTLFEAPTVAAVTERIAVGAHVTDTRPALGVRRRPPRIPLSLAQRRIWFLNQFEPESATYNLPFVIRLSGEVDSDALAAALRDVVERHESLRTIYPESIDGPHQLVVAAADIDLGLTSATLAEDELDAALQAFAREGFDVCAEPPIRVKLFELGPTDVAVAVVLHHIASDGASFLPFARDTLTAYEARSRGQDPDWAPLAVQYADYTLWQREVLGAESDPESVISDQVSYWQRVLSGLPDSLRAAVRSPASANGDARG